MNPSDPPDPIRRLLAARRNAGPRDGFVEEFIEEFHRRQRAEMLRTPAWRLAAERLGAAFADFRVPRLAYGAAFVAFVIAVLVTLGLPRRPAPAPQDTFAAAAAPSSAASMRLAPREVWVGLPAPAMPSVQPTAEPGSIPPRYVLDARPVSYEPPFSF